MAFLPFFSRPDPNVIYVDTVLVSVEIADVSVFLTARGVGCERNTEVEEVEDEQDEEA